MNITLRQLRAFIAVAEEGSFTEAAARLHVTQSAASALIRELESEIGLRLFDRTTRRVEPTDAGREFRASAARMLGDLDHAVADAHALAERRRGRVTIAGSPLLAVAMLPAAIADFGRRFPAIRVVVRDLRSDEIIEAVVGGAADCGIGTFPPSSEGIEQEELMTDALRLFCGRDHALAGQRVRWADLREQPLIALTRESGVRALIDRNLEAAGVVGEPAFEVTQMATAVAMIGTGLGIAVLPTYARAFAQLYRIVDKPIDAPRVSRPISFIRRRGRSLSPAAASFLDVLRNNLAQNPFDKPG